MGGEGAIYDSVGNFTHPPTPSRVRAVALQREGLSRRGELTTGPVQREVRKETSPLP